MKVLKYVCVVEIELDLDQGLGFSCTQSPDPGIFYASWVFPVPVFFLDYRPRLQSRSRIKLQSPGTGPGFSKISISNELITTPPWSLRDISTLGMLSRTFIVNTKQITSKFISRWNLVYWQPWHILSSRVASRVVSSIYTSRLIRLKTTERFIVTIWYNVRSNPINC